MPLLPDPLDASSLIEAEGRGYWLIGHVGEHDATCGDLTVRFQCRLGGPPKATVAWRVSREGYPEEAIAKVLLYIDWYLRSYLAAFPVGSLHVDVVDAEWLNGRTNEPKRAAFLAVHEAMSRTRLPARPLFSPPGEDPTV